MNTNRLALFGVIAVIVAAFVVWGVYATPWQGQESHILEGARVSETSFQYLEEGEYYRIEAHYPAKTSLSDAGADKAVRLAIEQGVKDAIDSFKSENSVTNISPEDAEFMGLGASRKYALGLDYTSHENSASVSYEYVVYVDTMGAHPNTFFLTFVFTREGKRLELGDLFVSGSAYLNRLSELAYPLVAAQLEERAGGEGASPDMLNDVRLGTAPTPEALQFFYLEGDALHLLFPPYQVAAYAAGSFDIAIPLSQLSDILKPEFK